MIFTTEILIAMSPEEQHRAVRRFLVILHGLSQELASVRAKTSIKCGPNDHNLLSFYIHEARLKLMDISIITQAVETINKHSHNMTADQRSAFNALIGSSPDLDGSAPATELSPADVLATFLSPKGAPMGISVPGPSCEDETALSPADPAATIISRKKELQEAVRDFGVLLANL